MLFISKFFLKTQILRPDPYRVIQPADPTSERFQACKPDSEYAKERPLTFHAPRPAQLDASGEFAVEPFKFKTLERFDPTLTRIAMPHRPLGLPSGGESRAGLTLTWEAFADNLAALLRSPAGPTLIPAYMASVDLSASVPHDAPDDLFIKPKLFEFFSAFKDRVEGVSGVRFAGDIHLFNKEIFDFKKFKPAWDKLATILEETAITAQAPDQFSPLATNPHSRVENSADVSFRPALDQCWVRADLKSPWTLPTGGAWDSETGHFMPYVVAAKAKSMLELPGDVCDPTGNKAATKEGGPSDTAWTASHELHSFMTNGKEELDLRLVTPLVEKAERSALKDLVGAKRADELQAYAAAERQGKPLSQVPETPKVVSGDVIVISTLNLRTLGSNRNFHPPLPVRPDSFLATSYGPQVFTLSPNGDLSLANSEVEIRSLGMKLD